MTGATGTPQEDHISTYSEPPSPLDLRQLLSQLLQFVTATASRAYIFAKRQKTFLGGCLGIIISVAFVLFSTNASSTSASDLAPKDRERVVRAVSSVITINTLSPADTAAKLQPIAYGGDNIGGSAQEEIKEYVVQPGDTLTSIAEKYKLHSGSITLANAKIKKDVHALQVGDVLVIPAKDAEKELLEKEMQRVYGGLLAAQSGAVGGFPISEFGYQSPIYNYSYVSQHYGGGHTGVDYAAPIGTPIYAVRSGCVTTAGGGWNGGYGLYVIIDHGNGTSSLYAHLNSIQVYAGACVAAGQVIGYSGNTGRSTGPHLHFEIRVGGIPNNPFAYVH